MRQVEQKHNDNDDEDDDDDEGMLTDVGLDPLIVYF